MPRLTAQEIEEIRREYDQISRVVSGFKYAITSNEWKMGYLASYLPQLLAEIDQLTKERDAAVADLCEGCMETARELGVETGCKRCKWRGVEQEEQEA